MTFQEEHKLETYKSLIGISTEAFKALQYLNGGAVFAVLTYLGQLDNPSTEILGYALCPLTFFILGLVSGTLVYVSSYITQFALYNEKNPNYVGSKHQVWLYISLLLCVLSLGLFSVGTFTVLDALSEIAKMSH